MFQRRQSKNSQSLSKPGKKGVSVKEAFKTSSTQLKQMLGHKLEKINKDNETQSKNPARFLLPPKCSVVKVEPSIDLLTEEDNEQGTRVHTNISSNSKKTQRYSRRVMGTTTARGGTLQKKREDKLATKKMDYSMNKPS